MELHSILFRVPRRVDSTGRNEYERLARVWEYSASVNSPRTPAVLHLVADGEDADIMASKARHTQAKTLDNARKTKHHHRVVQQAQDGELLCLMDCDTIVLQDLSVIEFEPFDLAYTVRPPKSRFPFNSGVVFVRISQRTKAFYDAWRHTMLDLIPEIRGCVSVQFGGINQTALGRLLASDHGLHVRELPCAVWNYENECFRRKLPIDEAKVLHLVPSVKGTFLSRKHPPAWIAPVVQQWRAYDAAAKQLQEVA